MNPSPSQYFRNAAAVISHEPAGYIRLEWQPQVSTGAELRAIYEHVLRALQHHRSTRLLTVHKQRPPMSGEMQTWLVQEWIPRAIREVSYSHCAIVEAEAPLSRLAARTVGSSVAVPLHYRYFDTEAAAAGWLRG